MLQDLPERKGLWKLLHSAVEDLQETTRVRVRCELVFLPLLGERAARCSARTEFDIAAPTVAGLLRNGATERDIAP